VLLRETHVDPFMVAPRTAKGVVAKTAGLSQDPDVTFGDSCNISLQDSVKRAGAGLWLVDSGDDAPKGGRRQAQRRIAEALRCRGPPSPAPGGGREGHLCCAYRFR
jgi:hypothetical protein